MRNSVIVEKLIAYVEKILRYCENVPYEAFVLDSKLVEACVFNLSQMGELANRVDEAFATAHPEVPWRSIYGLRNRIVHDYDGVNLQLIWEIIHDDLELLRQTLLQIRSSV